MKLENVLDGIDDIAWSELSHAYGPADDVPGYLRALMSADPEEADEALNDLWSSICHQGSVYPATAHAVPYLVRLAVAGVRPATLLGLLGSVAESQDERDVEEAGASQGAVVDHLDCLLPFLSDADSKVRSVASWALAQCRAPERLLPALDSRWRLESEPAIRASVLKAISTFDAEAAATLAQSVLDDTDEDADTDADLRFVAASVCLSAGHRWDERLETAATAWMADGELLVGGEWGDDSFTELVLELADRDGCDPAVRLVLAGLDHDGPAAEKVREYVVWTAADLVRTFRSAAAPLVGPIAALIRDEAVGLSAISLLRSLGAAAAEVADTIASTADAPGADRIADESLACLIGIGDARAVRLLARDLGHRPVALAALGGGFGRVPAPTVPFDASLLEAVIDHIRVGHGGPGTPDKPRDLIDALAQDNEPIYLAQLLGSWGPAAAPAIPELVRILPRASMTAPKALAAIGVPDPSALEALRRAAAAGEAAARLAAGTAVHSLTGDSEPLLAAIEFGLGQTGYALQATAKAAAALDGHDERLASALADALNASAAPGPTTQDVDAKVQLALASWRYAGDLAVVLRVLAEGLGWAARDLVGRWTAIRTADAAGEIGPAAAPLVPTLRPLLDDHALRPAAAHALLRIDPSAYQGPEAAALAEKLAASVRTGSEPERAVAVIGELGADALSPEVRAELLRLADQDRRIARFGIESQLIREDEHLRELLRLTLGTSV